MHDKLRRYNGAIFKIGEIESTLKDVVEKIKTLNGLTKTTEDVIDEMHDVTMWFSDVLENESFKEDGFYKEFSDIKEYIKDIMFSVVDVHETLCEAL